MKTISVALLFLGLHYPVLSAQQQTATIGFVRLVSGSWTLQGKNEPLVVGQPISSGEVPFIIHSGNARLVVGLLSRADPWEKNCTESQPCEGPYALPGSTQGGHFFDYLRAYMGGDSAGKRPAVFAGARDATAGPQHAVLVIDRDRILLSPTLSHFPAGRYRLTFTQLGSSAAAPNQFDVAWDGSSAAMPAVSPGFYALDAYSADGEHIGSHAAILVVRSSDAVTQQRWDRSLAGMENAAGPDVVLADKMRLATVLALKDGEVH